MRGKFYSEVKKAFEMSPFYNHKLPDPPRTLHDKFLWLIACGKLICPEYRFKWPQLDWWKDSDFTAYLEAFEEKEGMNTDRRWNLSQMLRLAEDVPGDTAECGCYNGASSYVICQFNRLGRYSRMHHIFDSLEGLSEPSELDGSHWTKHALCPAEDKLYSNLGRFTGEYRLYKGWIPERFAEVAGNKFSFVHIDVDLHQPTRDSISFFYPRLNPGGILLCDDYGFSTCPGCTKAVNDYMHDKPEPMISMASGGGFMIKK
jgi:hypothetical protein